MIRLCFFLFLCSSLQGQVVNIYYEYTTVIDTTNVDKKFTSEPFILSINADGSSVYLSTYKIKRDSIIANLQNVANVFKSLKDYPRPSSEKVTFKINKDNILVQNEINLNVYQYNRNFPKNKWVIGDKKKDVSGFICTNAFLDFSGRKWEAWFTEDLPFSNGPLLFGGLPGLILELKDTKNLHSFNFLGIDKIAKYSVRPNNQAIVLKSPKNFQTIIDNSDANKINEYESMGIVYSAEAKKMLLENIRNKKKNNNPLELKPEF